MNSELHLAGSRLYGMVLVYGMADSCLYNKQNNTWTLTRSMRSLVRYRCEHLKINSISPRDHVLFSIYYNRITKQCNFITKTRSQNCKENATNKCISAQNDYRNKFYLSVFQNLQH